MAIGSLMFEDATLFYQKIEIVDVAGNGAASDDRSTAAA